MFFEPVRNQHLRFHSYENTVDTLESAIESHPDLCSVERIGISEEGRPILGIRTGQGSKKVCLMAGAHADEPVGTETLRRLILQIIGSPPEHQKLLEAFELFIIPHVNPDGAARNWRWIEDWPDPTSYLGHVHRELPGRDIEFSYPDRRRENQVVSAWMKRFAPFHLHMSLHGMGYSQGAMLLIEKTWADRTGSLQREFVRAAAREGLRMHDHDRRGEKGFLYIGPGFTTTPEGSAMRSYFEGRGDPDTAALFGDSSMEYARSLGGDPLCLVTELPLFVLDGEAAPGHPTAYLEFREALPEIRLALGRGEDVSGALAVFGLRPLELSRAVHLQLRAIDLGLETIA